MAEDVIDFNNIMANKDAYFTEKQVQDIIDYHWEQENYDKAIFFMVLYRTGRRVSEILGKRPFDISRRKSMSNYKGLRPIDIKHNLKAIEFEILKKNHVKVKNKAGAKKDPDVIIRQRFKKKPKRVIIPVDDYLYNLLVNYIKDYNIGEYDRLFKFSVSTATAYLHEALKNKKIYFDFGTRKMYNPHTSEIKEVKRKAHLHMFRHSFAINFLEKNNNNPQALIILKRLLQHSSTQVTEFYLQFNQENLREMLNKTHGVDE